MIDRVCLLQVPTASAEGHCVWYGVCAPPSPAKQTNCYYNGTAQPIQDTGRVSLIAIRMRSTNSRILDRRCIQAVVDNDNHKSKQLC